MEPKLVNMSPLHFIPAAGGFLNFQVEPLLTADEDHQHRNHTHIMRIIPFVILSLNTLSYVVLDLPLPHRLKPQRISNSNIRVYIDTAVVVVISYVSLLVINADFIALAVFPFIALAFIVSLCNALRRVNGGEAETSSSSTSKSVGEGKKTTEEAEQLEAISVVPYWVLCLMAHFRAESFAVSQFLLFLSTTLGALMLMMARLVPAGGVAQASELLRKASLVVLLVTVHAMAAELLGENVVLFCMPEVVPALLWFSINIDRDSPVVTVDRIVKLNRNWLICVGGVAAAGFAYLAGSVDELGVSRCVMALVSCGVSGILVYYVVFMLRQWPAHGTAAGKVNGSYLEEAVQLLRFWANILLLAAAALLISTSVAAVRLGLHEQAVPALRKFLNYSV
uniref:Uncharacterized protein n=1 Tax=Leersia perrieri TaxID=77586 RepID=A0A0D9V0M1_9ORYZ